MDYRPVDKKQLFQFLVLKACAPSKSLAAGAPARVIKRNIIWKL